LSQVFIANADTPLTNNTRPPPMVRMAEITLVNCKLFHSFQTKYPMPVPQISISAATIAIQAPPMEILRPATIAGAAAGRITLKKRLNQESWSREETFK